MTTDLYIMGYSEAYLRILSSRKAADACAYLMPHLKPGIRVLDAGCGPGSISVGLAEAIAPGELRGIDIEPSQVEMAAQAAAERGLTNAKFSVADVRDLPFEDDSLDIVHCCDILAYIPNTGAVLNEMKRVLKTGGILGCREIILDLFMSYPDPEPHPAAQAYALFADTLEADDGHPQIGKELARYLDQSGFTDIKVSASFEMFTGSERLKLLYDLGDQWFFTRDVQLPATQYGAGTQRMMEEMMKSRERWYHDPQSMGAFAFGQALAVKP